MTDLASYLFSSEIIEKLKHLKSIGLLDELNVCENLKMSYDEISFLSDDQLNSLTIKPNTYELELHVTCGVDTNEMHGVFDSVDYVPRGKHNDKFPNDCVYFTNHRTHGESPLRIIIPREDFINCLKRGIY